MSQTETEAQETTRRAALAWNNYRGNPIDIPSKILTIPKRFLWDGVREMFQSAFTNRKTAVQAGHAMSKDWTAGVLVVTWLLAHWGKATVVVTAPTNRQVKDILFKEIAVQYSNLRKNFPEFRKDWISSNRLSFGDECFATGFTTDESQEAMGKFQGIHSPNMLIIISEAQAVPSVVFKQVRALMTSPNSRLIELGNPMVEFGDFYEHCTNPVLGYNVIHLPVSKSPNIVEGREVIPGMCSQAWLDELRSDLGPGYEEDPEYQSRALALFPVASAHAWIPLSKIKACVEARKRIHSEAWRTGDRLKVGGLDPAGEGDDETSHCVLEGPAMLKQDNFRKVLTPETVGWARGLIEEEKLEAFGIDEGYNPGIRDWLNFEKMSVIGISFGGKSPNEKYANMGTYMWALLRQAIMDESIGLLNDPILVAQLSSRRVEKQPNGQLKLESKKKSGRKSPDRADSLVIAWYVRLMMMTGGDITSSDSDSSLLIDAMEKTDGMRVKKTTVRPSSQEEYENVDDIISTGNNRLEADEIPY